MRILNFNDCYVGLLPTALKTIEQPGTDFVVLMEIVFNLRR